MRLIAVLAALVTSLVAIDAYAEDHHVPQNALAQLGLDGMQTVPQQRGMAVRGRGRYSVSRGLSFVSGFLLDPESTSFTGGNDTNTATAFSENVLPKAVAESMIEQGSSVEVTLDVNSGGNIFSGYILGIAGGGAFSRAR